VHGSDGRLHTFPKAAFKDKYEKVEGKQFIYRPQFTVLARPMRKSFRALRIDGKVRANRLLERSKTAYTKDAMKSRSPRQSLTLFEEDDEDDEGCLLCTALIHMSEKSRTKREGKPGEYLVQLCASKLPTSPRAGSGNREGGSEAQPKLIQWVVGADEMRDKYIPLVYSVLHASNSARSLMGPGGRRLLSTNSASNLGELNDINVRCYSMRRIRSASDATGKRRSPSARGAAKTGTTTPSSPRSQVTLEPHTMVSSPVAFTEQDGSNKEDGNENEAAAADAVYDMPDVRARAVSMPAKLTIQKNSGTELMMDAEAELLRLDAHSWANELRHMLSSADEWDFDIFHLEHFTHNEPLLHLGLHIFQSHGLVNINNTMLHEPVRRGSFNEMAGPLKFGGSGSGKDMKSAKVIDENTFVQFLTVIEKTYLRENPYHNNTHGADVMQSTHHFLCHTTLGSLLSWLEITAVLLAAAVHDVGHPGVSNAFQINSRSKQAIRYNDISVLENFHAATAFKVMQQERCEILAAFSREEHAAVRRIMIHTVLATDLAKHREYMDQCKSLFTGASPERSPGAFPGKLQQLLEADSSNKMLVLAMTLKCSDIGHPARPREYHLKWSEYCFQEFANQFVQEKHRELPISMRVDESELGRAQSQVGFIKYLVQPMYATYADFFDVKLIQTAQLQGNLDYWIKEQEKAQMERSFRMQRNAERFAKEFKQDPELLASKNSTGGEAGGEAAQKGNGGKNRARPKMRRKSSMFSGFVEKEELRASRRTSTPSVQFASNGEGEHRGGDDEKSNGDSKERRSSAFVGRFGSIAEDAVEDGEVSPPSVPVRNTEFKPRPKVGRRHSLAQPSRTGSL
jgi:hypothetical protein